MEPPHLAAWDVADFIEGELEPGELERVWEHLDRCEECVHWVSIR
jgi:anti-sigma factor RsiW